MQVRASLYLISSVSGIVSSSRIDLFASKKTWRHLTLFWKESKIYFSWSLVFMDDSQFLIYSIEFFLVSGDEVPKYSQAIRLVISARSSSRFRSFPVIFSTSPVSAFVVSDAPHSRGTA